MLSTWIEGPARGRHGGPIRAGMWGVVLIGTHPVEAGQDVWLELTADDESLGKLPAFWLENRGANSLWHVPIPPQSVGARLQFRSGARHGGEEASSPSQFLTVRPNLPERPHSKRDLVSAAEGLVGNRRMTVRVDARGSTFDLYFPTVGLNSDVRPAEGELPQSRSHFRGIVGGIGVGRRLDWFTERHAWDSNQGYLGSTNLLGTELRWRKGPLKVQVVDLVVGSADWPRSWDGYESPGQYIKRFRVTNQGDARLDATFGLFVQAEVNGGLGDPGLSWHDGEQVLLATNRGHGHANRKLARNATVEFGIGFDGRGPVDCEPTSPNEALLIRPLVLNASESTTIDVLISGAFSSWAGDHETFEHWIRPAMAWFRSADIDAVEQRTAQEWDAYVDRLPSLRGPRPLFAVAVRRSSLATALHVDSQTGGVASGFDRGLSAYCWPREAASVAMTAARIGHPEIAKSILGFLETARERTAAFGYWFQKYTIDGRPEWETPSIDQTALVPFAVESYVRQTGDLETAATMLPAVRQAAKVCCEGSAHPGLRWLPDLCLLSSSGAWDMRYGAFLYANAAAVAGLRAAAKLGDLLGEPSKDVTTWRAQADRIWEVGILGESDPKDVRPGLVDRTLGRFLEGRRISARKSLWSDDPAYLVERSTGLDISMLSLVLPFGLIEASDTRMTRTLEAILRTNHSTEDPDGLTRYAFDPLAADFRLDPGELHRMEFSSLATLWAARTLLRLGRETSDERQWDRALDLVDAILRRLDGLGLSVRLGTSGQGELAGGVSLPSSARSLHVSLIDAILDLGGLEVDMPGQVLRLSPILPNRWPSISQTSHLPCGTLSFTFQRGVAHDAFAFGLRVDSDLTQPMRLEIELICPGLEELGPWSGQTEGGPPQLDTEKGRIAWSLDLAKGPSRLVWSWGRPRVLWGTGV